MHHQTPPPNVTSSYAAPVQGSVLSLDPCLLEWDVVGQSGAIYDTRDGLLRDGLLPDSAWRPASA